MNPNSQRIVDLLLKHGLIDLASVDDPEGYDNGATLAAVQALAADLSAGPYSRDAVLEEARSWASAMYEDSRKDRYDIMFKQGWEAASEAIEEKLRALKNAAPQVPAKGSASLGKTPAAAVPEAGKDDALERLVDQSVAIRARQSATEGTSS